MPKSHLIVKEAYQTATEDLLESKFDKNQRQDLRKESSQNISKINPRRIELKHEVCTMISRTLQNDLVTNIHWPQLFE